LPKLGGITNVSRVIEKTGKAFRQVSGRFLHRFDFTAVRKNYSTTAKNNQFACPYFYEEARSDSRVRSAAKEFLWKMNRTGK
jgi:hypothetical protein